MDFYQCTDCHKIFDSFPAANNHEKEYEYEHLTYSLTNGSELCELVVCACGCGDVLHAADAHWNEETDLPYTNARHIFNDRHRVWAR